MNDEPKPMPASLAQLRFTAEAPRPVAITTFEDAWRLATLVCQAKMAPSGMDTPEQVTVALLHGAEIGLPPMMSIQRIAVIGGRPSVWGDAALAIIEASNLLEDIEEWIEGEGDARTAYCKVTRRGRVQRESHFSVADAKRAGLWDDRATVRRKLKYDGWINGRAQKAGDWVDLPNDNPWFRFPDRMLTMRARGFRLRDSFPDRLGGLYIREELDTAVESEALAGPVIEGERPSIQRRKRELGEPPEPPPFEDISQDGEDGVETTPQTIERMSPGAVAALIENYEAHAKAAVTEADLDTLWNDLIAPRADALHEDTVELLANLDNEARSRIQMTE